MEIFDILTKAVKIGASDIHGYRKTTDGKTYRRNETVRRIYRNIISEAKRLIYSSFTTSIRKI